jgi:ABC-2 type transport system ATP-binding protein
MSVVVKNLVKVFGNIVAVDSINFSVEKGEIFGLLGPNGAGKTTTMKILCTLLKPTSGDAFVEGYSVRRDPKKVREKLGVVFQESTLDIELTVFENLDLHGRLYGMGINERRSRIDELLELVNLEDYRNVQVKKLSGGMKRKLEVIRGIMHSPDILILDEPTLGLDAATRRTIWRHIEEISEDVTIILSTHYMEEAEKLCDRVAVMRNGKIVALDSPQSLKERIGEEIIVLSFESSDINVERLKAVSDGLTGLATHISLNGNAIEIHVKSASAVLPEVMEVLRTLRDVNVKGVEIRKPTLEDVFITLSGDSTSGDEHGGT